MSALSLEHLDAWWGPAQALFDITLEVGVGELVLLQGLNGAGKSTLLQAVIGLGPSCSGAVSYAGQRIEHLPAYRRSAVGLGYVAEDRRLFADLSVCENLRVAARGDVAQGEEQVLRLFPALRKMLHRRAREMSGGEQQMLAIGRTLMTRPRFLLLDEPCEGIAPVLAMLIRDALLDLRAQGMSMLVAEQNPLLVSRADRVITLRAGQRIAKVEP